MVYNYFLGKLLVPDGLGESDLCECEEFRSVFQK